MSKKIQGALRTCGVWSEHKSRSGKIYYYNYQNKSNQWQKPAEWDESKAVETDLVPKKRDVYPRKFYEDKKQQEQESNSARRPSAPAFKQQSPARSNASKTRDFHDRRPSLHQREQPAAKKPLLDDPVDQKPRKFDSVTLAYQNPGMRISNRNANRENDGYQRDFRENRGFRNQPSASYQAPPKQSEENEPVKRRKTIVSETIDELKKKLDKSKQATPETLLARQHLEEYKYRYNAKISKMPNYPSETMKMMLNTLQNERQDYRVGSLFNSKLLPSIFKSRSATRAMEIKGFRQKFRIAAIGEQMSLLRQTLRESFKSLRFLFIKKYWYFGYFFS